MLADYFVNYFKYNNIDVVTKPIITKTSKIAKKLFKSQNSSLLSDI